MKITVRTEISRIDLYNSKYTYVRYSDGTQEALRYGKHWRNLTGDGFILALANELENEKEHSKRV